MIMAPVFISALGTPGDVGPSVAWGRESRGFPVGARAPLPFEGCCEPLGQALCGFPFRGRSRTAAGHQRALTRRGLVVPSDGRLITAQGILPFRGCCRRFSFGSWRLKAHALPPQAVCRGHRVIVEDLGVSCDPVLRPELTGCCCEPPRPRRASVHNLCSAHSWLLEPGYGWEVVFLWGPDHGACDWCGCGGGGSICTCGRCGGRGSCHGPSRTSPAALALRARAEGPGTWGG